MKGTWILAELGVLAAMIGDGHEAHAGSTAIVVKGGYKPGTGDPTYDFIFQVYLQAPVGTGSNSLMTGDSFTISNLPGVTSSSLTSVILPSPLPAPDYSWSYPTFTNHSINPYLSPPYLGPTYSADVHWAYTGSSTVTTSTNAIYLGQFSIQSIYDFAPGQLPIPNDAIIKYSFTFDGQTQSGDGTFPITNLSVPEPSSVILLLAGAGMLPLCWLCEQRQRQSSRQSP
jgi:hypothetical protein